MWCWMLEWWNGSRRRTIFQSLFHEFLLSRNQFYTTASPIRAKLHLTLICVKHPTRGVMLSRRIVTVTPEATHCERLCSCNLYVVTVIDTLTKHTIPLDIKQSVDSPIRPKLTRSSQRRKYTATRRNKARRSHGRSHDWKRRPFSSVFEPQTDTVCSLYTYTQNTNDSSR